MKISVLTPSFNSGKYIERAIQSVIEQRISDIEHIIVDGGSKDNTLDILKRYPQIKWISEPDKGQSDAMNKAFSISTGEIIGNLNADDSYLPNAFKKIIPYFNKGEHFVMGRVKILQEDGSIWVNDPRTEIRDMVQWWDKDAYCRNPVGYFYRRTIQERVGGFNINNHNTMDLEFLLEARKRTEFLKIKDILGIFYFIKGTKTASSQSAEDMERKFSICEKYITDFGSDFIQYYHRKVWKFLKIRHKDRVGILKDNSNMQIKNLLQLVRLSPLGTAITALKQLLSRLVSMYRMLNIWNHKTKK
jgi:glycosyltransferase involved in cell wall biosynthesis